MDDRTGRRDIAVEVPPRRDFATHPALHRFWWVVGRSVDVRPGEVVARRALGLDLAVWRGPDGVLGAALDRCPHREAPLSRGDVTDDGCLRCPYHGWEFAVDGRCTVVPSQRGSLPVPARNAATTVHVAERHGLVWICPGQPGEGIIDVPESADPAYRTLNAEPQVWNAAATRIAENFLDASHFSFVHVPSFGSVTDPEMAEVEALAGDTYVGYRYRFTAANPEFARTTTRQSTATVQRTMTMTIRLPFVTLNTIDYESGLRHVILNAVTPVDEGTSLVSMTLLRNDDHSVPAEEAMALDLAIIEEDRQMLELIPGGLPLDPRALAHAPVDRAAVEWLRRLAALLDGPGDGAAVGGDRGAGLDRG